MSFLNPNNILNQFGVPNYLQNGNFEAYDTFAAQVAGATKWNAYKDAAQATPVDGTGGTPTVIRNASVGSGSQLRGTRSWQITKTGNAQGEGYSQDFTIDLADIGQLISISFDFSAGSAYTTGDLGVFIYDITNSTLITPSVIDIPNGAGLFRSTFVATTSTSYRIIFHCAASNATTTNWSMTVDNIQVSKNEVVTGAAVTDWVSFSPSLDNFGTATSNSARWRRVGDSIEMRGRFVAGTTVASAAAVRLPNNLQIDMTKLGSDQTIIVGHASRGPSATTTMPATSVGPWFMTASSVDTNAIYFSRDTQIVTPLNRMNGNTVAATGDSVNYWFQVPVANWSSNANFATSLVEYASNTSTTDANDTTSFGYGAAGSAVPTVTVASGASPDRRTKRVRFTTPIQPTDIITIETQVQGTGPWTPVGISASYASFTAQGASEYGIGFRAVSGSTTDIDVDFWRGGRYPSGATYAAAGAAYPENASDRWRVRKSAGFTNVLQDATNVRMLAATGSTGVASNVSVTNFARITMPINLGYGLSGGVAHVSLASADQHYGATVVFNRQQNSSLIIANIIASGGSGTFMGSITTTQSGNELRFNYVASSGSSGVVRATIIVQSVVPNMSVSF